jgi:transcription elongation GreA/GreB family factor
MNKAFVKEMDDERASNPLPDRTIPSGPNLVTPAGLIALEQRLAIIEREHADAVATGDVNEIARTERDRRYWTARRATAEVTEASGSGDTVEFGSTVTIRRDDGRTQTLQIVGVDQADPAQGTLSYISPLARALLGKSEGDEVTVGGKSITITEIK